MGALVTALVLNQDLEDEFAVTCVPKNQAMPHLEVYKYIVLGLSIK